MKKLMIIVLIMGLILPPKLLSFDAFIIKNIQVEGNQNVSEKNIISKLGIYPGYKLTAYLSNIIIHNLYNTGLFKKIELERVANTLFVKVKERPFINTVKLIGINNNIEDIKKILTKNNVDKGKIYLPTIISKIKREIYNYYLNKQFCSVKINAKVILNPKNLVNINIQIHKENIATIKRIKFMGNKIFNDQELYAQIFHKKTNWLSIIDKSDSFFKETFQSDLEMLRSFYMDKGYLEFKFEYTQVSLSLDKKYIYITINIYEGPQYFLKSAIVKGNMHYLQDIVDKKIKIGDVFSRKIAREVKELLEHELHQKGYSKASVIIVDNIDKYFRQVGLSFNINLRKRISVRHIVFLGNTFTQDDVLRNKIGQHEGDWLSISKIKDGKKSIIKSGYARQINMQISPVLYRENQVDVIYRIKEKINMNLSTGISYTNLGKLLFNINTDLKNYIGNGKDINFLFTQDSISQTYDFSYLDPYFLKNTIFNSNLYHRIKKINYFNIYDYSLDKTGLNMSWQYNISKYDFFKIGIGYNYSILNMNYDDASINAKQFMLAYGAVVSHNTSDITLGLKEWLLSSSFVHNTLNSHFFPTHGILSSINTKLSIPGGDIEFYKVDLKFNYFYTLFNPIVLNIRGKFGYEDVYKNKLFPFYKNYYLGGSESIRGYEENSLGPMDSLGKPTGGNMLVEGHLQFIFPVPFYELNTVRMALFLDAGQVYDTHKKNKFDYSINGKQNDIRYTTGLSFMWNTPLQVPISCSVVWPLNSHEKDVIKAFIFSMGTEL